MVGTLAALDRAWRLRSAGSSSPMELTTTQFGLARAVYATGDRRRAKALAMAARDRLGDKPAWASSRTEIETWLAAH